MAEPTEEVYSIEEFAHAVGVPCETVEAWKRNNQVPSASMTPDGRFIKSVIDPFIEWYKNEPTSDTPMRQEIDWQFSPPQNDSPHPDNDFQQPDNNFQEPDMAKKKIKKTYSQDARQEAIRLVTKEKLSAATVAKQLGCSYGTVLSWQKKEQEAAVVAKPKASPKATPEAPPEVTVNPSPKPEQRKLLSEMNFDTFVRNFWNEGTRAVDVLLLPPELSSRVVNYVNESLKYAFETLR